MAGNQKAGNKGEQEVILLVACPNCGKSLMKLPKNYPLYDVQCIGCSFRAQVKTNNHKPTAVIFGAGWEIMNKVLKSGFLTPPMIANFKWKDKKGRHQEIRFYPLVPKKSLHKYKLSKKARRANYWMFNYIGLNDLPHFVVHRSK